MKIGYCRVSTDDQNPDLQLAALKRAGCKRIFTDKASGAHVTRPELTFGLLGVQVVVIKGYHDLSLPCLQHQVT